MTLDRPCFPRNSIPYIYPQRNRYLQLLNCCLVQMVIQDINQSLGRGVYGNIALRRVEKRCQQPLLSCGNNVYLFRCLQLLINSDLLLRRLFPLFESIFNFSFRHKQHFLLLKLWTFSYDAPTYFWNKVVSSNFPVFFRQFCVVCVIFMGKGLGVVYRIFE